MQIALPEGWSTQKSSSKGMMYFFNRKTGESTWEHPAHQPGKSTRDAETQFNGVYKPEEIRTLVPTPRFLLNRRRSRSPFRRSPAPSPSPARRFRSPSNHGMNAVPPQVSLLWQDSPHWVIAPQNYPKGKSPNGH